MNDLSREASASQGEEFKENVKSLSKQASEIQILAERNPGLADEENWEIERGPENSLTINAGKLNSTKISLVFNQKTIFPTGLKDQGFDLNKTTVLRIAKTEKVSGKDVVVGGNDFYINDDKIARFEISRPELDVDLINNGGYPALTGDWAEVDAKHLEQVGYTLTEIQNKVK